MTKSSGLIATLLGISTAVAAPTAVNAPVVEKAVPQQERLAFALLEQLDLSRNQVLSPYSLSAAVGLAYVGANGETKRELSQVFGFADDVKQFSMTTSLELKSLAETQSLQIANRAWVQKGVKLQPEYTDLLAAQFQTPIAEADFKTPQARISTAERINNFVKDATNKKITNLVNANALNTDTRLLLVNAIHFAGKWKDAFDPKLTKKDTFTTASGRESRVPFMHQEGRFAYVKVENKLSAISLPYQGERLSMTLVLPEKGTALKDLAHTLQDLSVLSLMREMSAQPIPKKIVKVKIPKFKFASTHANLIPSLETLGAKAPFSPQADFSKLTSGQSLAINQIIQKAMVEVHENGTTAAAATGAGAFGLSLKVKPEIIEFHADHPFLYFIHDQQTNQILFTGVVADLK